MPKLIEQGYRLSDESTQVIFYKILKRGVRCEIDFQLLQHFKAPNRLFDVGLSRIRPKNFPKRDSTYSFLAMPLRSLLQNKYGQSILPPEKALWEFTDEISLSASLANIEPFLIEFGINWVEDPLSTMNIKI